MNNKDNTYSILYMYIIYVEFQSNIQKEKKGGKKKQINVLISSNIYFYFLFLTNDILSSS